MTQNTPSHWVSSVSEITPDEIYIRGYPMSALVGELPFSAITYLLVRGQLPSRGEAAMMDVILSSILDYALQKSGTVAARAIVSVNPRMTAGLAAAMLGAGEYAVSPEDTGRFIADQMARLKASGEPMHAFAEQAVADLRSRKQRIPGFGHPVFKGLDPRAEKLKSVAVSHGLWGEATDLYEAIHRAFKQAANKPDLVMNDVGMLAAIMTQMGFTPAEMTGLALMSTFPGLVAHISEELQSGVVNRLIPDANADYTHARRDLAADLRRGGGPDRACPPARWRRATSRAPFRWMEVPMSLTPVNPDGQSWPGVSMGVMAQGRGILVTTGHVGTRAGEPVTSSAEDQLEALFENLKATLDAAGLGFEHVAQIKSYVRSFDPAFMAVYRAVRARHFKADCPPASVVVQAGLYDERLLIESEVIAVVP